MYREIIIIIIFLAGLIFCFSGKNKETIKENFVGTNNCPNLLLQSGNEIFLYNSNRARIPGVNPIKFNNLDEYVEFTKWQRTVGIQCPILYLQQTYDSQNNLGWRPLNDPIAPRGGMLTGPLPQNNQETLLYDANRLDPPYNQSDFPAYDPMNQYIGDNTPLDKMFNSNSMDTGYASQRSLDKGYYTQKNNPSPSPLQYNSESQYIHENTHESSPPVTVGPKENNAEYTQQMVKNQEMQNSAGYVATPQTSSMAQYVGARTNPPDGPIENPPSPTSNTAN